MVRDLMLKELILPDCKRAFTIVEAQLALLRDYFFLAYQINWLSVAERTGSVCNNIPSTTNTWFRRPPWKKEIGQYSDYDAFILGL
uniref:Uncharacterized protein n=1 Tax=Setaria viridis TaxID=4556 RepID=A0A4U6VM52_SETVI|nr:hypothetical protein SEVIR_2G062000v2 [Setaria viridis]TKW30806.1 hypothetical protein SEVIR_2G062000v2 [Setaria viridis]